MERSRRWKVLVLSALVVSIAGMGLAFAALSTTLNITGSAKISGPQWNIRFDNMGSAMETGGATADVTPPTLTDAGISNVKGIFDGDGTVAYEFDVRNDGLLDAQIGTLTILDSPTCTGTGSNQVADETLVCNSISTTLTYVVGGLPVSVTDTLASGEVKRMRFTIIYDATGATPDNEVNVNGLGATIIYEEQQ